MVKKEKVLPSNKLFAIFVVLFILSGFFVLMSGVFYEPAPKFSVKSNVSGHSHTEKVSGIKSQQILDLENLVESNPSDFSNILNLAHLLGDNGFLLEAVNRYNQYLKKYPDATDVIVDKGVCYYSLRNYTKASEIMKTAIETDPKHEIAHLNLGIISMAAGNKDEAKKWWNKLIKINPNSEITKRARKFIDSL